MSQVSIIMDDSTIDTLSWFKYNESTSKTSRAIQTVQIAQAISLVK